MSVKDGYSFNHQIPCCTAQVANSLHQNQSDNLHQARHQWHAIEDGANLCRIGNATISW